MTTVSRIPSIVSQDEIDLFHILGILWRRKVLIFSVALFTAALGGGYAFLVTPEYEVSTVLRPAALNDLDALNRSEIYSLPPGKALVRVGAALDSYDTRLNFFRSKPELIAAYSHEGQTPEQAFSNFNKALVLVQPNPKKADLLSAFIGLKMRYEEGLNGAAILNAFVSYTVDSERVQLAEDLKVIVNNRLDEVATKFDSAVKEYEAQKESKIARLMETDAIKRAELQDELKALRVQLKMHREARLIQLEEAISIARSLGLKKPATPSSMADEVAGANNIVRTEVNSQEVPLYFMGSDVLEAERNALRKRVSDDFTAPRIAQIRKELLMLGSNRKVEMLKARENEMVFLEGIDVLRAERTRLENIKTDMQQLRLVSIDQFAVPPSKPVSPHKLLIVVAALMVGLGLGAAIALMRGMFKRRLRQVRIVELQGLNKSGPVHS
ncbi:Wzz/FepE/Etk N-terminal domain-containing protein [Pseudomonas tussilaginis]|uniref:Wzz/FepE/Etk N-terminal domain-containing protein n=1 Tax=unclassified Pseudomonas TaxID=196821 RepID=UPI001E2B6547|nr:MULTISPECIES: Wzz/FepE/Etk N-terminal domain-containing protein [unclassified Pseudomonas]